MRDCHQFEGYLALSCWTRPLVTATAAFDLSESELFTGNRSE